MTSDLPCSLSWWHLCAKHGLACLLSSCQGLPYTEARLGSLSAMHPASGTWQVLGKFLLDGICQFPNVSSLS